MSDLMKRAEELKDVIVKDRRTIHETPEINAELPETTKYVIKCLKEMGYEPKEICNCGVVATTTTKPGKVLLLRADMDAMPMQETRQESKTVPLHQPAAPAGPAQTANTPRSHSLALKDRSRLALTCVTRIISCDENAAVLETPLGNLTVGGQGLQVSELSVASGQVQLSGKIEYLQYAENRQSGGSLLARLFR